MIDDFPHGHPEMDPTDDEREALVLDLKVVAGIMKFLGYKGHADTVLRAVEALHRTVQREPSDAQVAEIEQRVYDENKGQIAGMAKALVRAGWDAAAGFRRTEVPEPSAECPQCHRADGQHKLGCGERFGAEPQAEPSDAQVLDAQNSMGRGGYWVPEEQVRAALRAAGGVR